MLHHRAAIQANNSLLDLPTALSSWTVPAMEDAGIPRTFGYENR